jgi:hypothetical protein
MDLYHLRQGLHVIASSWDYHGGAESRISICRNSVRFSWCHDGACGRLCDAHGQWDTRGVTDATHRDDRDLGLGMYPSKG